MKRLEKNVIDQIVNLYKQGRTSIDIQEMLGVSSSAVYKIIVNFNLERPRRTLPTKQQEKEIIELYKNKTKVSIIAEKYNIHRTTIQLVLKRNGIQPKNHNIIISDKDIEFLRENYPNNGASYCAKYLGLNAKALFRKARALGIKRKRVFKNTPIQERLRRNLRFRISTIMKKNYASPHTIQILGCSVNEFMIYISNKFKANMAWENYGPVWEIDHIIPCASFDLTMEENINKCFHYTNLQPLWITTSVAQQNGDFQSIGNRNKGKIIL